MLRLFVPVLSLSVCLLACDSQPKAPPAPGGGGGGGPSVSSIRDATPTVEAGPSGDSSPAPDAAAETLAPLSRRCDAMDVLFVVDNSESMAEEQANLAANFPRFVEVLNSFSPEPVDYRIGVTTTAFDEPYLVSLGLVSPAEEGALLQTATMLRPWLERDDPGLAETFAELATVGTQGSVMEQPLRAAVSALTDRATPGGPNARFLREDALLAIIVVTDEDDFSTGDMAGLMPLKQVLGEFDSIKRVRERWSVAVLAGDEVPQCRSDFGSAGFASRLLDFVAEAGENAAFGSICTGDLAAPLARSLELFQQACLRFPQLI